MLFVNAIEVIPGQLQENREKKREEQGERGRQEGREGGNL